jgi:hypothetical protein
MDKKKRFMFGTAVSDYNFIGREKETQRLTHFHMTNKPADPCGSLACFDV